MDRAVAGGGPPGPRPGPKRKILRGADLGLAFLILYLKNRINGDKLTVMNSSK